MQHSAHSPAVEHFGATVPMIAIAPFVIILLGIALMPLVAHKWWESNRNRAIFSSIVTAPILAYLLLRYQEGLWHALHEYTAFIALLGALYIIAGGIHISGDIQGTPGKNVLMLAIGAVLANIIGTTGASMLLIRPMLRINQQRKHVAHIPFLFILIVSNCAGLLTPLGDPPLFLGYLRGVPFFWTLHLWPAWLICVGYLLILFYLWDSRAYTREDVADLARDISVSIPLRIHGNLNILFLAGVVGSVFLPSPYRELSMGLFTLLSWKFAPRAPRIANMFTFSPIIEVAVLFLGIFITMVPALAILENKGPELGLHYAWEFFLTTGFLSSVLDNAPTYLTFLTTAQSLDLPSQIVGISHMHLAALSCGAVFMGANTYIGNGPNFMVKAIAEEARYKMPSFFAFMLRSVMILTPIYLLLTAYFLAAK
ncbi:MAG: sodium:proton antiporter [Myxococcales bacterium]|nr:MAG: sodium:proton antiporter [Myxococcales bacterium]